MFKNPSKIMFFFILMIGTLITISSNTWLGAWMGLEINLLSFIPLMTDNNLMSSEASLKYFLVQALASSILLFSIISNLLKYNIIWMNWNMKFFNMMTLISLMLKSGTAPFHFWFPGVMEGLSWMNNLILMTWQKIAPLMLISFMMIDMILLLSIFISILVGSLGGLNQSSLRKIMAFSSINHLGWMLISMWSNESLWFIYFIFYSFLSMTLIFMFYMFNLYHINQMFSLFFENKIIKFSFIVNLLSLGGLPPFLGFFPKMLVIQFLSYNQQLFSMMIIVMLTLITLFFYIRLCFSSLMLNYYENSWNLMNYNLLENFLIKFYLFLTFFSLFGFILLTLIYFIL